MDAVPYDGGRIRDDGGTRDGAGRRGRRPLRRGDAGRRERRLLRGARDTDGPPHPSQATPSPQGEGLGRGTSRTPSPTTGGFGTSWTPSPTTGDSGRRGRRPLRREMRDIVDAVPYDGGTRDGAGRRGRRPLRRDRERGEENKNANKNEESHPRQGVPRRESGVPVCGWFSSFIAVCYARAAEQSGKHQDLK